MSLQNRWAKHYQSAWNERAQDERLPDWLRIASLAFARHAANGHARFAPGEIAQVLERVDKQTGALRRPHKANIQRAIRHAVDRDFLAAGSSSLCLVVPPHAVEGGLGGSANTRCPHHDKRSARTEPTRPTS